MSGLKVDVLRRSEDLLAKPGPWIALCRHPEAHPAIFKAVADTNPDLIRPHIVVVSRDGQPIALAVSRIQYERLTLKIGPLFVPTPRLRVVRLSYDGIVGDSSPDVFAAVTEALFEPVRRNEADAVFFDHIRLESLEHRTAYAPGAQLQRDLAPAWNTTHWTTSVSHDFETFLRTLSKGERSNYKSNVKTLEAEFGKRLRVASYRNVADLDVIVREAKQISVLTYQSTLGASFADQAWAEPWLKTSLEHGIARCYFVYIDDVPKAFCIAHAWKGTLTTHFMGYDPALADFGVGRFVSFAMIAEACADPDIQTLDFGFGDALYKRRLCKVSWQEVDRYVFARRLKPMTLNIARGLVGHTVRAMDGALTTIGVRERLRSLIWRRIKQPKVDVATSK